MAAVALKRRGSIEFDNEDDYNDIKSLSQRRGSDAYILLNDGRKLFTKILYRGLNGDKYNMAKVGKQCAFGQESYSENNATARKFAEEYHKPGPINTILILEGNKYASNIKDHSEYPEEEEWKLMKGTRGIVKSIELIDSIDSKKRKRKIRIITFEVLPQVVWLLYSEGKIPSDISVLGGHDINGENIYIGRALHKGDKIPGKVVPSHGVCYVSYDGFEHAHKHYTVLTNPNKATLKWLSASNGEVPNGAIAGGIQSNKQKLYIGRATYKGSKVVGKVHPSHKTLYVPFDGKEVSIKSYEVLVCENA